VVPGYRRKAGGKWGVPRELERERRTERQANVSRDRSDPE